MDRYAVVGNPIEHSQSPFIHALFAKLTGQDLGYERLLSPLDGFETTVRAFAEAGGRGCNITVPFKGEAWSLAPRRSPRALMAGVANTLRFDAEGWWADNTDGVGLVRDITQTAAVPLAQRRVLLVGAGGAASGVLGPLLAQRPAQLVIANRTLDKAVALAEQFAATAREHGVALASATLDAPGTAFDVVINGSASSLQGSASPVPASVLREGSLALDMMYGPAARGFLDWAAQHGAVGRDGLGMLVEQAAESFAAWRGVQPETAPALAALRGHLAALGKA